MEIAIGLPNAVAGTTGDEIVEWARRAEARGFSSLSTIDRIVYDNYEPLVALGAAAAVTERIGLCTSVLLGPLHTNDVELAKQALTLHSLSNGRFTLGIALGAREDDYEISGLETRGRGRRFTEQLKRIKEIFDGDEVGPKRAGAPSIIVGGVADASFRRAAELGDGWVAGGGDLNEYTEMLGTVTKYWNEAGREGEPRAMALVYYGLGSQGEEYARKDLTHYYAWLGEEIANMMAGSAATDADAVRSYVSAYERAGCQELIFFPTASDPEQVDLLADALGL